MRRIELLSGVTVLALGFLSAVPAISATEPPEVDANTTGIGQSFALDQGARIGLPLRISKSENLSFGAVAQSATGEPSASELNRQLTNPVSSIWSISNQFNNFELNNGHWNNNWNFQPVLPVSLTAPPHPSRGLASQNKR